jgi:hypothetical protein
MLLSRDQLARRGVRRAPGFAGNEFVLFFCQFFGRVRLSREGLRTYR